MKSGSALIRYQGASGSTRMLGGLWWCQGAGFSWAMLELMRRHASPLWSSTHLIFLNFNKIRKMDLITISL